MQSTEPEPNSSEHLRKRWRLRTRFSVALLLVFYPVLAPILRNHPEALPERRQSRVEALSSQEQTPAARLHRFARYLQTFAPTAPITLAEVAQAGGSLNQP